MYDLAHEVKRIKDTLRAHFEDAKIQPHVHLGKSHIEIPINSEVDGRELEYTSGVKSASLKISRKSTEIRRKGHAIHVRQVEREGELGVDYIRNQQLRIAITTFAHKLIQDKPDISVETQSFHAGNTVALRLRLNYPLSQLKQSRDLIAAREQLKQEHEFTTSLDPEKSYCILGGHAPRLNVSLKDGVKLEVPLDDIGVKYAKSECERNGFTFTPNENKASKKIKLSLPKRLKAEVEFLKALRTRSKLSRMLSMPEFAIHFKE